MLLGVWCMASVCCSVLVVAFHGVNAASKTACRKKASTCHQIGLCPTCRIQITQNSVGHGRSKASTAPTSMASYVAQFTPKQLVIQLQEQALETQITAEIIVKKTELEKGEVDESDCLEENGELIDAAQMLNRCITILSRMCENMDQPAE